MFPLIPAAQTILFAYSSSRNLISFWNFLFIPDSQTSSALKLEQEFLVDSGTSPSIQIFTSIARNPPEQLLTTNAFEISL